LDSLSSVHFRENDVKFDFRVWMSLPQNSKSVWSWIKAMSSITHEFHLSLPYSMGGMLQIIWLISFLTLSFSNFVSLHYLF